jgi:hypothetical protein
MTIPPTPSIVAYRELTELTQPCSKLKSQYIESADQLRELWMIDADAYGDCSISFECFLNWWERYPYGNSVIFCDGTVIASIGLWPISAQQATAFIEGEIPEAQLVPLTLQDCQKEPQHNWYASGIVLKNPLRGNLKNNPIKMLLERGVGEWFDSGHIAYPMRLLALAEYTEGENLLTRFNFMQIRTRNHMPDKCDLYSLQINTEEEAAHILKARNLW